MQSADILGQGGTVAAKLPGFETRPQQLEMVRAVEEAFEKGRHLVVEAGTGVADHFKLSRPVLKRPLPHGRGSVNPSF